jgi:hypothetical protein
MGWGAYVEGKGTVRPEKIWRVEGFGKAGEEITSRKVPAWPKTKRVGWLALARVNIDFLNSLCD